MVGLHVDIHTGSIFVVFMTDIYIVGVEVSQGLLLLTGIKAWAC